MKRRCSYLLGRILCTSFLTVLLCPNASTAKTCEQWIAKVVSVQGTVESRSVGETQWQPVKLNDTYCPGDVIRVLEKSRADLVLINQSVLRLKANSEITLTGVKEKTNHFNRFVQRSRPFLQPCPTRPGGKDPLYHCRCAGNRGLHKR